VTARGEERRKKNEKEENNAEWRRVKDCAPYDRGRLAVVVDADAAAGRWQECTGTARVGDIVVAAPPPRVVSSVGHRYPPSAVRSPVVTDCTRGVDTRVLFVVVAGCRRRRGRCRVVFVSRRRRVC